MKKWSAVIPFLSLLLVSCTAIPAESLQVHIQYQATLTDVFNHHYSVQVYQFEQIMKELSEAKDKEHVAYVAGMIESYRIQNPAFTPAIILTNEETKQILADKELQEHVVTLFQKNKAYLNNLQPLLEQRDLAQIQNKHEEFSKLHALTGRINDNRLFSRDPSKIDSYKKELAVLLQAIPE